MMGNVGCLVGLTVGAYLGIKDENDAFGKKYSRGDRIARAFTGSLYGAVAGTLAGLFYPITVPAVGVISVYYLTGKL